MQGTNILVVDDSIENTFLISEVLKMEGYSIDVAYSGQKALEIIAQDNKFDLIILDIMMPEMNGLEVCQILKSQGETKDIPVIFMSSLSDSENIVTGLRAGGVDYIAKPFNVDEVLARVKTHVTIRLQQEKLQEQYTEINRLQEVLKKFVSQNTWQNIEADSDIDTLTKAPPKFETATVMFTDIADFTTISEAVSPAILIKQLADYMSLLSEIIHRHDGQIDKFLGDGLFAFFESAVNARLAAIEIQQKLFAFNEEQLAADNHALLTRIGLATGEILQVTLGFNDRLEHTLIGDRVNTAARLQSEAPSGGIVMDETTYRNVGEQDVASARELLLKGKTNPELSYILAPDYIASLDQICRSI